MGDQHQWLKFQQIQSQFLHLGAHRYMFQIHSSRTNHQVWLGKDFSLLGPYKTNKSISFVILTGEQYRVRLRVHAMNKIIAIIDKISYPLNSSRLLNASSWRSIEPLNAVPLHNVLMFCANAVMRVWGELERTIDCLSWSSTSFNNRLRYIKRIMQCFARFSVVISLVYRLSQNSCLGTHTEFFIYFSRKVFVLLFIFTADFQAIYKNSNWHDCIGNKGGQNLRIGVLWTNKRIVHKLLVPI